MKHELNVVKFVAATLLLIFGRKGAPYTPLEACQAIDFIAKHNAPEEGEDYL